MNNWLETTFGANAAAAIMWIILAVLVLIVLLVVLRVIKTVRSGTFIAGGRNRVPRLAVVDATAVDAQRRLVLVRRDNVEHLILIGGPNDITIEPGIHTEEHDRTLSERQMKAGPPQMPRPQVKAEPPQMPPMKAEPRPAPAPAAHNAHATPHRPKAATTTPDMQSLPENPRPPHPERPKGHAAAPKHQAEPKSADILNIVPSKTPVQRAPEPLEASLEEEMGRLLEDISVEETKRH